jgi:hypothetical protein
MTYTNYSDQTITRITYGYYRSERAWAIDFYTADGELARGTDWIGSGKADAIATVKRYEQETGITAERI